MMPATSKMALLMSFILGAVRPGSASNFRRTVGSDSPLVASSWARAEKQQLSTHSITESLKSAFSPKHHAALHLRVDALKQTLRPLFAALPKNSHGRLEHGTARYALHRYFVRQYSAYIVGLEPLGDAWNASSPLASLAARTPEHVQAHLEQHLQTHGFDLQELALLGASLEMFLQQDAETWLREAYELTASSLKNPISAKQFHKVADVFLWVVLGKRKFNKTESVSDSLKMMPSQYPDWNDFQALIEELRNQVLGDESTITFANSTKIVDLFMDHLGPKQLEMCNAFADTLIKKDTSGTARVRISEFYGSSSLSETPETLRKYGVLAPETEGYNFKDPRVIIPNYVASATNCLAATDHYALCCPDACEGVLSQIEFRLASPTAAPDELAELVATIPSRLQPAPRKLSDTMLTRLRDIAEHHDGRVPVHGRLFAQWLHHAYPYECMFPSAHITRSSVDFHKHKYQDTYFSDAQAREFMKNRVKDLEGGDLAETLPWLTEEQTFVHVAPPPLSEEVGAILRCVAFCGALFGSLHVLMLHIRSTSTGQGLKKAYV
eukprot:TRINITY_DN45353_c0_g1_i1.p1 TRINITY_DN45353_c0_g1~~TRINITY_DN45353_c0_g1_i1.p1  ORF type:complete len:578 (+),score=123.19 TRINITY_DN45353_c0_g1_i1:78-1736(+)